MLLYLVQHAKAKAIEEDPEEGITEEGRGAAIALGKVLKRLDVWPEHLLVSPKKRSKETADCVMKELGLPHVAVKETEAAKAKAPLAETIRYIQTLQPCNSVMIVGHLPSLHLIAQQLSGADIVFQNGGCLLIDLPSFDTKEGKIVWLLPPQVY